MQMVPSKKLIGLITKRKDGARTFYQMVRDTKVNGLKINNMVKEERHGQTVLFLTVFIVEERNLDLDNLSGLMAISTRGSSETTSCTALAYTSGQTVKNIMEIGLIT